MEEMGGANMVTYYMSVLFLQMGLSHFMVSRPKSREIELIILYEVQLIS